MSSFYKAMIFNHLEINYDFWWYHKKAVRLISDCFFSYPKATEAGAGKALSHVNFNNKFHIKGYVPLPKASPNSECEVAVRLRADTLHPPPSCSKSRSRTIKEETISSQQTVITPQDGCRHEYTVKLPRIAAVSELFLQLDTQNLEGTDFMLDPKQFDFNKRDLRMFRFVTHLDKRLLSKNERAIILAHTGHISHMTDPGIEKKNGIPHVRKIQQRILPPRIPNRAGAVSSGFI